MPVTFDQIPLDAQFVSPRDGARFARIRRIEREQVMRRSAAFGVFDAKGREIGHSCAVDREFHIIDADAHILGELSRLDLLLEESFIVYPQGLRDGVKYGALPTASYKRFKTLAEALAYVDQTLAAAEKRALKKASA
jgi:hypothetical protein